MDTSFSDLFKEREILLEVVYELRSGYLLARAEGEFETEAARNIFLELAEKSRALRINRILCDITCVSGLDVGSASVMTRFEISNFVARSFPRDIRLAILETPPQLTKDQFDENVMINRGASVKVTIHLQEALEWLGVEADSEPGVSGPPPGQ